MDNDYVVLNKNNMPVEIWEMISKVVNLYSVTAPSSEIDDEPLTSTDSGVLTSLRGRKIKVIGYIGNSEKKKINYWSKKYGFGLDIVSDEKKLKTLNLTKCNNFAFYDAIIVGAMPHSSSGIEDYNSPIEKLKHTSGVPVFECRKNNLSHILRFTVKNLWDNLSKANDFYSEKTDLI